MISDHLGKSPEEGKRDKAAVEKYIKIYISCQLLEVFLGRLGIKACGVFANYSDLLEWRDKMARMYVDKR